MARVKIHENQLTLRDELHRAPGAASEGEPDAESVEAGALLRPSAARRCVHFGSEPWRID